MEEDKQLSLSNQRSEPTYLMIDENMKLIEKIKDLRKDSNKYLTQYKNLKTQSKYILQKNST